MMVIDKSSDLSDDVTQRSTKEENEFRSRSLSTLNELKDLQVMGQILFQQEAQRLTQKLGANHPRVKKLEARTKQTSDLVQKLEIGLEIARIRVPQVPKEGALVHGRITDKSNRGIARLTVYGEGEKGNRLLAFGSADTDTSGYFAIQLTADRLSRLQKIPVYLTVGTLRIKEIHRVATPLKLAADSSLFEQIVLDQSATWEGEPSVAEEPSGEKGEEA